MGLTYNFTTIYHSLISMPSEYERLRDRLGLSPLREGLLNNFIGTCIDPEYTSVLV